MPVHGVVCQEAISSVILFLARKYVANTLIFAAALTLISGLSGGSLAAVIPASLFWGSVLAVGYTFWRFQKQNIWPLYDNLRLPRFVLFAGLFLLVQFFNLTLTAFL